MCTSMYMCVKTYSSNYRYIVIYGTLYIFQGIRIPQIKATFCGNGGLPMDYYSGYSNVQVTFQSNAAVAGKGFKLRYSLEGILVLFLT
jgi:hypothetical protein